MLFIYPLYLCPAWRQVFEPGQSIDAVEHSKLGESGHLLLPLCVCNLMWCCDPYPLGLSPPHLALSDVLHLKPGWIKMFFSPINKSITAPVSLSMLWISVQSQFPWKKKTAVYSQRGVCVWYPPVSTALITVSGDGSLLRSWDSATGALKWEVPTDLGTLENQQ